MAGWGGVVAPGGVVGGVVGVVGGVVPSGGVVGVVGGVVGVVGGVVGREASSGRGGADERRNQSFSAPGVTPPWNN